MILSDGGVYDNLGLETAWKEYDTILVSDGGGATPDDPHPSKDWARHAYRVLELMDNQVGSLRKRWVIGSFQSNLRKGTYWGISSGIAEYGTPNSLPSPADRTLELASTPTRLKALGEELQQRLVNWGYAICDAAIRKHYPPALPKPANFPFKDAGV